jgi:hypothetical protein
MSASLNMNEKPYYSWKGLSFNKIIVTSVYQKNQNNNKSVHNLFLPPPLKIYRKELGSTKVTRCNRSAISINELNQPNGYTVLSSIDINNPTNYEKTGIPHTLYMNTPNSLYDTEKLQCNVGNPTCNTSINTMSESVNALKRVRSSGMIRKNNPTHQQYYTSNQQYLNSRNLTYKQNQYKYVSNVALPPTINTNNINITQCKNPTPPVYKPNNTQFAQQGAVTSSSLVTRLKYDTINSAAATLVQKFGNNTANALAYNTSFVGYTAKDKLGFPSKRTPVINKYSNKMTTCVDTQIRG